ncbi:MAG: putative glycoside hydrolase [Lachnospiraceae bacterium]|nr:putative glycoside hydrolase [Lachnospiraceae bacterium]
MMAKALRKKEKTAVICFMLTMMVFLWGCGESRQETFSEEVQPEMSEDAQEEKTENGREEEVGKEQEAGKEPEAGEVQEDDIQRPKVKGIFVTGPMAGTDNMENLIDLVDRTELNAIVMDVKNDEGRVVYKMQIPEVEETGAGIRYVQDMEALMEKCKEKDIYMIARVVAFKDPFLAEVKPEWCIHNPDGSVFKDKGGLAWLNPYNREVWDYLAAIAQEALNMGFDEVQFDYLRFSTDNGMDNVDLGQEAEGKDRQQIITEFVQYMSEKIHESGGVISADVYGMVIDSETDQKIVGQNYVELSEYLDYISPMIYPSHYGPYNYNIPVPDAEPYRLVLTALQSSKKVLAGIPVTTVSGNELQDYTAEELAALEPMAGIRAQVRPWLQDFTATWVSGHISYEAEEIRAQIQAVYDAGYEEWILWNASNRYTEDGLLTENEVSEE